MAGDFQNWRDCVKYAQYVEYGEREQRVTATLDALQGLIGPPAANAWGKDLALSAWFRKGQEVGLLTSSDVNRAMSAIGPHI